MPVSSSLLLLRPSLFWCCFDMSNPEDTQTTEASQESQDSQKSSRNKETTRSTADCLQWAIGEGIGDHLSLTDSQGESQNEVSKEIPEIPRTEWERYIVLPAPSPLPETTSARVAWWEVKAADFPILSSIAVFFVRRPRSACHVERAFSLLGHILTHDRRNMSNETLRHLAILSLWI